MRGSCVTCSRSARRTAEQDRTRSHIHEIHEGEQCQKATNSHQVHVTSGSRSSRVARLLAGAAGIAGAGAARRLRQRSTSSSTHRAPRRQRPAWHRGRARDTTLRPPAATPYRSVCTRRPARTTRRSSPALDATGVPYKGNFVDHNSFQDNITTYLQQPDDVFTWFAGYRMRFFAEKGLTGDISDVWANFADFSDSFKAASTGNDGKQYLVPPSYYPWAVHYRKSLFEEKGYTIPTTKDELVALATKMQADGLIPFAYANDGKWPVQGTFDILNLRLNGYQFHVDLLAGKEDWTGDKVKNVFATWTELLPFHQENPNGRTWQEAATALENKEAGMFFLGTFVAQQLDAIRRTSTTSTSSTTPSSTRPSAPTRSMRPIDGFMMAAKPKNVDGAKALLAGIGTAEYIDATSRVNPSSVPCQQQGRHVEVQHDPDEVGRARRLGEVHRRSSSTATPAPTSCPTSSAMPSPTSTPTRRRSTRSWLTSKPRSRPISS